MRVLSLGWGLQSFALAAMSALGELPPLDAAIHADTTHERSETYAFAKRWTPWLEARGVKVVTVKAEKTRPDEHWGKTRGCRIPAFTTYPKDIYWNPQYICADCLQYADGMMEPCESCGSFRVVLRRIFEQVEPTPILIRRAGDPSGMLNRQCTRDWKISPINREISNQLKIRGLKKSPAIVDQWLGITLDEIQRMKPSRVKYIKLRFPFVEIFDPPMSRWRVARWLQDHGLEIPAKSSCVFCPYHDQATWREIKRSNSGDWEYACEVDVRLRRWESGYYVHRDCVPLSDVDLRDEQDHGQLSLWDEECTGYCFL